MQDKEAKKAFVGVAEKFRNQNDFGPISVR